MIRSLMAWSLTWIYMVLAGLLCLPGIWITGRLEMTYAAARFGVRSLLALAGVRVEVEGREWLPAAGPRLYMANHQSNLDPPILITLLPGNIAFLAKQELFAVPVLGWVLRAGGLVPINRADREGARHSIARAATLLRNGRPFLIFPEGTRSPNHHLLPFKKGPFYLAEEAAVAVVPITIGGSGSLMPRGSWRIHSGTVRLVIHPPLLPAVWASDPHPRAAAAAAVRAAMAPPA
ncbi:MAG: lysophospholipid acyltransferase family protein [Terriglobales bacterium]